MPITRSKGGALCNPFPIIGDDPDGEKRRLVCEAHRQWLRMGGVPAHAIRASRRGGAAAAPPGLLRADGTSFPPWMRAEHDLPL